MNALITGGAGFIGSHLAEALLARGHCVTVIDDLSTGQFKNIQPLASNPRFRFAIDSVTNEVVMDRLGSECDVIFHLAAAVGVELIISSPVRVIETNILGTEAVLRTANRYRRKVLIASTSEIYGKSEQIPFREDSDRVLGPTSKSRWSYSDSKAVDEFLALAYHKEKELPVVIFRLFNTVGPRQSGRYGMVIPRFVSQALRGKPLQVYGDGQQSRCFCDVQDAVQAIIGLADCESAVGEIFNIGTDHEITILELAEQVLSQVRQAKGSALAAASSPQDSEIVFVPYDQAYEAGFEDMRRRVPNLSKIQTHIGWQPTISFEQTLERAIRYQRDALQLEQAAKR
jgi:UDP-glucose 4-epimerase